jgi:hypothetical protein
VASTAALGLKHESAYKNMKITPLDFMNDDIKEELK